MNKKVVIIGLGEMGGVFARGFLRLGIPVYPVIRTTNVQYAVQAEPNPDLVLLAVAEKDLHTTLATIPDAWKPKLALLQNELLPSDWSQYPLLEPTVISVWFEKKKGQDVKVLIPSPVFGAGATLIKDALNSIDIPVRIVSNQQALEDELVLKNVYILTTNIAGLVCGGDVGTLWREHNTLARDVANDVMDVQAGLVGKKLDREKLFTGFVEAVNGDLSHQCMGRSAPTRLARVISLADTAGLKITKIREIAKNLK